MNQQLAGEHLFPGYLGQFLLILGFVSALFTAYSYFCAARLESRPGQIDAENTWKRVGRGAFVIHALSIVVAFSTLFYIISNHLFEYHYAWRHSSKGLQVKYLFSCFWEGSEGSFMLWAIWQAVLGLFLLIKPNALESRVMVIVAIVQALLCTMLLGFYLGPDIKIGSTPFTLLRHEMQNAPIMQRPDYLSFITDGNGLNPLLQNYWMVIHPPVLFLGFALTLFPFAYCMAAVWKNEYKVFVKPALRWALACGGILGLGIMMGGAWAYESLNFGGYWAWDPVENASLVPWLILVAGLHTLVVYKSTGRSLRVTMIFFVLSFMFVWYSTFLTRTGILGDTSVHAFTGAANFLYWHLLIVMGVYLAISLFLLIRSWKKMPKIAGEEDADSREFWMLIGSVFLLISSLIIIMYTSLPVWAPLYNKISGSNIAPPEDPVSLYNNIQVWFGIITALLSGAIQFLKYKKTAASKAWKQLGILAAVAIVLTAGLVLGQHIKPVPLIIFAFTIIFTIIANIVYLINNQKGKVKKAGASVTHFGFGLMLLGVLLSGYGKRIISLDQSGKVMDYGMETFEENARESRENVLIFRNTFVPMDKYLVTYLGDSVVNNDPPITYYKVRFDRRDPETNQLLESFVLTPDVFVNPKGQEGISPNPDAKHYLTHDIFTYISSISDPESKSDTSSFIPHVAKKGDTIFVTNGYVVFDELTSQISNKNYQPDHETIAVNAVMSAYTIDGKVGTAYPVYMIKDNQVSNMTDTLRPLGLMISINKINPQDESIEFGIRQRAQQDDYVVVKAMIFPYIGVLWTGIIVMFIGFAISWSARRNNR